ncbi:MAG: hypothetical protein AB7N24_21910 [Dehalococcoidia bacterium]
MTTTTLKGPRGRRRRSPHTNAVSFRLPHAVHARLQAEAELHAKSIGTLARERVIDSVQDRDRHQVLLELQHLRRELDEVRRVFALVLETVLVNGMGVEPAKAHEWVRDNIIARRLASGE